MDADTTRALDDAADDTLEREMSVVSSRHLPHMQMSLSAIAA